MTYSRIIGIIDDEKHKIVDVTTRSKPVIELRDRIKPQVVDLVKKQRLLHLTEGALFHTFTNRGRQQRANWCCRLSPNHRVLHWNTPDDSCTHVLPLEELPKKGTLPPCYAVEIRRFSGHEYVMYALTIILVFSVCLPYGVSQLLCRRFESCCVGVTRCPILSNHNR